MGPEEATAAAAGLNTTSAAAEITNAGHDEYWQHSHVGTCSYGEKCRFPHVGKARAKSDSVCDEHGNYRKYILKHGDCFRLERGKCHFLHDVTNRAEESLSTKQHGAL